MRQPLVVGAVVTHPILVSVHRLFDLGHLWDP